MKKFRIKKNCKVCNKEFEIQKWREPTAKYCSNECRATGYNYYWTFDKRKEQAIRLKGRHISPDTEFKKGVNGKENHPMWKGGISLVKGLAMVRDSYKCIECGIADIDVLTVDHVVPISVDPLLKYSLENLVTLCANCHIKKTRKELRDKIYKNSKNIEYASAS